MNAVLCAERRGRTSARSIDAALLPRLYSRNCDYLMIKMQFVFRNDKLLAATGAIR